MQMFRHRRRCALPVVLFLCATRGREAHAQSASFEPDGLRLPLPQSPAQDRAGSESQSPGWRRADHVTVGALVGVGFPRPLAVEGIVKVERMLLLGLEYSVLPQITVSNVQASSWAVAGDARVFPFRGPFFVGLRAGEQHLSAETSLSAYGYTVPTSLSVDTVFLNPRLGFLWTWQPGITLGIDAGVQIPLSSSVSSTLTGTSSSSGVLSAASTARQSVESVAGSIGQTTLPTVDLLRVGFLF